MAKELLMDCVVKPLVGTAVTIGAACAIGVVYDKVQDIKQHRKEKRLKKDQIEVKGFIN